MFTERLRDSNATSTRANWRAKGKPATGAVIALPYFLA